MLKQTSAKHHVQSVKGQSKQYISTKHTVGESKLLFLFAHGHIVNILALIAKPIDLFGFSTKEPGLCSILKHFIPEVQLSGV